VKYFDVVKKIIKRHFLANLVWKKHFKKAS
jgi:hypothetical protein